jgi:hypothetical protein
VTSFAKTIRCLLVALWITLLQAEGGTQEPLRSPLEPSNTSSPATMLQSLISSCNELAQRMSEQWLIPARARRYTAKNSTKA